jgi:hypothetical protein
MALGSASITTAIAAIVTKPAGGSTTQGRTNTDLTVSFTNGTAAGQVLTVIDANLTSNNGAIALSTLYDTVGDAFGSLTKLKGLALINPSTANATTFFCNATGAPTDVSIPAGGSLVHMVPTANGITVAAATTIRSNGTATDSLRVVMFLA